MISLAHKLKNEILKDKYNSIVFKKGRGKDLYLVGGYIRNILRGIHSPDKDYIVSGDIISFANEIRDEIGGTTVKFKRGNTIRIAFKDGSSLDFSDLIGTIEEDLSKRDFTINTVAWSPEKGIIDPYNGLEDIKQGKIRSISDENLIADPLRMLRAYRLAAELGGYIEKTTRNAIKMHHHLIKKVSSERITFEFFNLLNSKKSAPYLKMALSDGILTDILSIPYKTLENKVKEVSELEETTINRLPSKIKALLKRIFSQNLTYKGLLSLEILMQGDSLILPEKIKASSVIKKRLEMANKGFKELKSGAKDSLFDIFLISKKSAMDILIMTGRLELLKDLGRFEKILKKGHLSSEEIKNITGIKEGPELGKVIMELKKAQFEGKVRSKKSAARFATNISA